MDRACQKRPRSSIKDLALRRLQVRSLSASAVIMNERGPYLSIHETSTSAILIDDLGQAIELVNRFVENWFMYDVEIRQKKTGTVEFMSIRGFF